MLSHQHQHISMRRGWTRLAKAFFWYTCFVDFGSPQNKQFNRLPPWVQVAVLFFSFCLQRTNNPSWCHCPGSRTGYRKPPLSLAQPLIPSFAISKQLFLAGQRRRVGVGEVLRATEQLQTYAGCGRAEAMQLASWLGFTFHLVQSKCIWNPSDQPLSWFPELYTHDSLNN